eukprot:Stramenopile-MAST_4_protein_2337
MIPSLFLKHTTFFRVVGKVSKLFKTRNDTDFIRKEVKLVKTRLGKWYIAIPVAIGIKECRDQEDICALDPGVRTFQTVYGTDGAISHVGTCFDAIEEELLKADKLLSEKTKNKTLSPRQRRNYQRRYLKCFERVRNRIRDLHHKVSSWLCQHYRFILLPIFETQGMTSKLQSPICRKMMTWSHYTFKRRLLDRAQHFGCKVFIVNESFTSKTCGECGVLNETLGSSEVFHCSSCNATMDRDVNAARNILLRNLPFLID